MSGRSVRLRRAALLALALERQHLTAAPAGDEVLPVLDDLVGLHATVPSGPFLQLRARMPAFVPEQLDVLLDQGRVAKLACMRRTLFMEPAGLVPVVFAATRELTLRGRERYLAAYGLTPRRYAELAARVEGVLGQDALDASELRARLDTRESLPQVIIVMCDEGRLVRWRGRAGWQSPRPRYRRLAAALPGIRLDSWDEPSAVQALIERYIRRYGPVRDSDIAWWTGLRKATVRRALATVPNVSEATVDGLDGAFLIHEADVAAAARRGVPPPRSVSLLPALDPYLQSYRDRDRWIDPPHRPFVVDRGGNTTSVILLDGRAAGVWDLVRRPSPELRLFYFGSVTAAARRCVRALAAEMGAFLTGELRPVIEVEAMAPLTQGSTSRFLSPLKDPG